MLDLDANGYLSESELIAWVRLIRKLGGASPDGDLRDVFGFPRVGVKSLVTSWLADCEENGRMSIEEFRKLAPRLKLRQVVARLRGTAGSPPN